jgi:hypothetical protein
MKKTFKTLTSYFNYIGKLNIQYMKEKDAKVRENLKKEIEDLKKLGDKKATTWAEAVDLLDQVLYSVGNVVSSNNNEYAEKLNVLVRALKNDNMITPNTEKSLLSQFKAIEADAKKGYKDEKDN